MAHKPNKIIHFTVTSNCRSDLIACTQTPFHSVIATTYLTKQTSTIHSVDTELICDVLKLSFSKQYKIQCFNPLCQGLSNFFVLRPNFEKRFFYAASLMDSLDVNNTCKRLIKNLKMHFCQGENIQMHTVHESS